jgi:WD40 repeat protein
VAIARHGGPAEGRHTDHSASGATSISYTMLRRSCMIPFWVCAHHKIRWWNLTDGRQYRAEQMQGEFGHHRMALSRDGTSVAVQAEKAFAIYDASSGRTVREIPWKPEAVDRLTFSPDGKLLAVGINASRLLLISLSTGRIRDIILAEPPGLGCGYRPAIRAHFSADGKQVLIAGIVWKERRIIVFDTVDGRELFSHAGDSVAEDLSPDGKRIAFCTRKNDDWDKDVSLRLIDLDTAKETVALEAPTVRDRLDGGQFSLSFTPDGNVLTFMGPSKACLIDAGQGKVIRNLTPGMNGRLSPNGKWMAEVGWHRLHVWDAGTGRQFEDYPDALELGARVIASNGSVVAIDAAGRIGLWDANSGRFLHYLPKHGYLPTGFNLAFTSDDRSVATCESLGVMRSWNLRTGTARQPIPVWMRDEPRGRYLEYRISPDGRRVAAVVSIADEADAPTRLEVWDARTGSVLHRHALRDVQWPSVDCWLPDGSAVIIGHGKDAITIVDPDTGRLVSRLQSTAYQFVSGDSRLIADWSDTVAKKPGNITVREIASAGNIQESFGGSEVYRAAAVAPFARAIVVADRKFLRIIDLATGKERGSRKLPGIGMERIASHTVSEVQILPGDQRALTTLHDGTALIWDLTAFPPPRLADKHDDALRATWWNDLAGADAKIAYVSG